ncbi:hypothetical protein C6496_10050 [Candidatus Poribacteria bacterium]|nr:MAG: hypothetical protein C6496_10050 [Candidatus Poribacteria bacterium]
MRILLYLSLFSASVAYGAVEVENATFGFSDGYKTGTWAPLTVTVWSQDEPDVFTGKLVVEVQNFTSDTPFERYATPLRLSPTGRQQKHFYVYCPKNATRLVIKLLSTVPVESERLHAYDTDAFHEVLLPTPIARKDYLVLVLAPSGDKLKRFIDKRQLKVTNGAQVHVKYLPDSTSLLRDWIGYSAVDVLVIRETFLTERHVSKAKQTALLDWVQRGGTLIMSGGGSFNALRGSFVEPFLPVELNGIEKTDTLSDALYEQLGFHASGSDETLFERIVFAPKVGCETLIGTKEEIYVAKRNFGDGQILCLAYDYNALPLSEQKIGEAFWQHLLSESGKSPRHLADQYALSRQHEERIYKQFLSKMPTQVPLIKLLAVVLPVYLLIFGGLLLNFGRSKRKSSSYWIGSCLFIFFSVCTIAVARNILPNKMTADQLSILSVYPERQRAHLQSFVSIRTVARTETSFGFPDGTFIRHQETELTQRIGTLMHDSSVQLQGAFVEPWHPTTYIKEAFTQQLPVELEDAWRVTGKQITYLGDIPLRTNPKQETELSTAHLRLHSTSKMPPDAELNDTREAFARILQQEGVLQYLMMGTGLNPQPYIIGWTSRNFTDITAGGNFDTNSDTLVIFRPNTER